MTEPALDMDFRAPKMPPDISATLFADNAFAQPFSIPTRLRPPSPGGDQLLLDNPYPPSGIAPEAGEVPLLSDDLKTQLAGAGSLEFTTAAENEAAGAKPDYRITVDKDGKLVLEKLGDGDPLADGKLNIEVDAKDNQSIAEAIKQADQNLKEYIREMMSYWRQNHGDKPFPGWWNDVLSSQPNIPANAEPVPIRPAEPKPEDIPAPPSQDAPEAAPPGSDGSAGGGGRGGGGGGSGGGGGGGGYRGGAGSGYGGPGNPAPVEASSSSLLNNVKIVAETAEKYGVDPKLAVATMLQESGGNSRAVGDGGDSVGLFQLNENGLGAGMSVEERMDPRKNAEIAIKHMAETQAVDQNGDGNVTGGDLAVTSQRPAEHVRDEYVANVDGPLRQQAEQLINQAEKMDDFNPDAATGGWGGFENGRVPDSALVDVHGFKVAPSIEDNLTALLNAAHADGVWQPGQPYATGAYRDYDTQVRLKAEKGDMAATPGHSMHGWGLAIDFNMNNRPLIDWLAGNAERFGFKNLPGEPWHYSTNGH